MAITHSNINIKSFKQEIRDAIDNQDKEYLAKELSKMKYTPSHRSSVAFFYQQKWGEDSISTYDLVSN